MSLTITKFVEPACGVYQLAESSLSPVYVLAQARWLQQAREGRFDNEDDYDDDASAFSSSADQGPPGQHCTILTEHAPTIGLHNMLSEALYELSLQIFP